MSVTQVASEVVSSSIERLSPLPPFCVAIVFLFILVGVFILGIYIARIHLKEFNVALPADKKSLAAISSFSGDVNMVRKVESKSEMEDVEGKNEDLLDRMLNRIFGKPARVSPEKEQEVRQAILRMLA